MFAFSTEHAHQRLGCGLPINAQPNNSWACRCIPVSAAMVTWGLAEGVGMSNAPYFLATILCGGYYLFGTPLPSSFHAQRDTTLGETPGEGSCVLCVLSMGCHASRRVRPAWRRLLVCVMLGRTGRVPMGRALGNSHHGPPAGVCECA